MKERIATIAAAFASLKYAGHIRPDGDSAAAALQVAIEQAAAEAIDPPPPLPVDAALQALGEKVEALGEHVAALIELQPAA